MTGKIKESGVFSDYYPFIINFLILICSSVLILIVDLQFHMVNIKLKYYIFLDLIFILLFCLLYIYVIKINKSEKKLDEDYQYYKFLRYREETGKSIINNANDLFLFSDIAIIAIFCLIPLIILRIIILVNLFYLNLNYVIFYFLIYLIPSIYISLILILSLILTNKEYLRIKEKRQKEIAIISKTIEKLNLKDPLYFLKKNNLLKELNYLISTKVYKHTTSFFTLSLFTSFIGPILEFLSIFISS